MDRRGSSACGPLTDSFGLVEGRVAKLGAIVVVGWRSLESQANRDQALPPLLDGRRNWALSTDPFGLFGGRVEARRVPLPSWTVSVSSQGDLGGFRIRSTPPGAAWALADGLDEAAGLPDSSSRRRVDRVCTGEP